MKEVVFVLEEVASVPDNLGLVAGSRVALCLPQIQAVTEISPGVCIVEMKTGHHHYVKGEVLLTLVKVFKAGDAGKPW